MGWIHHDNPKQAYIVYWLDHPPSSLPVILLGAQLKAIVRRFIVLFHTSIQSPPTIHPHLNLLPSPSRPTNTTQHPQTVPIL
jgi:hypothetical protein